MCGEERGAPGKADRAALLGRLLDFPRLLDVCALYGAAAPAGQSSGAGELARLVAEAVQLLPRLGQQAVAAGPIIAQNLGQVVEACLAAAGAAGRDAEMAQSLQGEPRGAGLGSGFAVQAPTGASMQPLSPCSVLAPACSGHCCS